MGGRILTAGNQCRGGAQHGFTLVETMIAMSISVIVVLANIYLFNTTHRDLSLARTVTQATNLATEKIAEFRAKTIAEIAAASSPISPPPCPSSARTNPLNRGQGSDTRCPECANDDCTASDCSSAATRFDRTWRVASVDLDHNSTPDNECDDTPDMCSSVSSLGSCDVVNVSVEVAWYLGNKNHRVAMTTFVTGNTP